MIKSWMIISIVVNAFCSLISIVLIAQNALTQTDWRTVIPQLVVTGILCFAAALLFFMLGRDSVRLRPHPPRITQTAPDTLHIELGKRDGDLGVDIRIQLPDPPSSLPHAWPRDRRN